MKSTAIALGVLTVGAAQASAQVTVDFETDLGGTPLQAGTIITDQLAGMTVTASNFSRSHDAAIIFDTASPTGGDTDLATPGYHPTNTAALGKVLILAENILDDDGNGLVDEPDDEASRPAGWIQFDLSCLATGTQIMLLDMEEIGGSIDFSLGQTPVGSIDIPALGNNSVQTLGFGGGFGGEPVGLFDRIRVNLPGSGAIASVTVVPAPGSVALLVAAASLIIRRGRA